MATSSTSPSSSSSAATNYFNGSSTFAADLNNQISHAVAVATLPITELQNQQPTLPGQQTELQTIGSDFTNLQTALGAVDSAVSSGSLAATVDTPSVASASIGTGALTGSYAVTIASLGAQTNTISNSTLPTVSDPSSSSISTSSSYTLTVGTGSPITITPTSNNLNSLVAAINASGAPVQATVVNVGGTASPNYELSIQGTQYANTAIQLNDGKQNLLTQLSLGSPVTYQVNGQPSTPASSSTRSLSISTGLTVDALATGTANVTVAQSASGVSSALSSLVTSYNAAVDEVNNNRGQNGGALAGQSILLQLSNVLHSLTDYSGTSSSGSVQSPTDLGLTFDTNGHLQFDSTVFNSAASSSISDVMSFLGSESGATGFLSAASTALSSVTDTTSGAIVQQMSSLATSISNIGTEITNDQTRLTLMQSNLTAQMAAADAAVASMQSQVSELTAMFSAENTEALSLANG